jgi:long-chain acyl-CoA synthetase
MVLSKLRTLGAPAESDGAEDALRAADGSPLTFPDLLEDNRRAWGGKIAFQQKVRREWHRISHEDVHKRTYELAAGLVALGAKQGDRIALIGENSIDWACAYYAIVAAGGVAVPIYYDLKATEVAEMVERAGASMAFVSTKALAKFEARLARVQTVITIDPGAIQREGLPDDFSRSARPEKVSIEDARRRATAESRHKLAATIVRPDDLASVVFTSGTTGGMKGVMLTHRNFMANMASIRRSIPFNDRDRIVMVLPMHHAFPFVVGIAVAPAVGGELTFENDLRRIRDRMTEVKPTLFLGVPALFEIMYRNIVHGIEVQGRLETFNKGLRIVDATKQRTGINIGRIVFRELHKRLGGSLRFMVSGAAPLNPQVGRSFARLGVPIIQGWGLTEAAPVLSVQRWQPRKFYMSNYYEEHFGTVGPALDGVEIGLIDVPEKELYVHLHGEGELVARGGNISPGYWKSDEASEASRVGEWLRTGDVGRIDDEGNIWITGRSKFVIVLDSGEKVHPDELEEKLERSPIIEDVAIVGRKMRGKMQAWAVIYPNRDEVLARLGDGVATEAAVRSIVAAELDANTQDVAAYKRPADFVLADISLPRTMPLRKIARGQIADNYTFDPANWELSWAERVAAAAVPPADDDDEEEAAAAG